MRRMLLVVLVVAGVLGLAAAATAAGRSFVFPADPANPVEVRGCVIRFDTLSPSGNSVMPRIHANASHYCVGVTSVKADWSSGSGRGNLVIQHGESPPIVGLSVSGDEWFAEQGIVCGASGGAGVTRIACYDRDGTYVPAFSKRLYDPYANLWISWFMWDAE